MIVTDIYTNTCIHIVLFHSVYIDTSIFFGAIFSNGWRNTVFYYCLRTVPTFHYRREVSIEVKGVLCFYR